MHRRQALKTLAAGAAALNAFPGLRAQDKPPRTQLGIVVYCLSHRTQQLREQQPGGDLSDPLTLFEHCRQLGAGGVQMPLGVRDEAYTRTLREKAEQSGMFVEGIVSPPSGPADVERFDAQLATAATGRRRRRADGHHARKAVRVLRVRRPVPRVRRAQPPGAGVGGTGGRETSGAIGRREPQGPAACPSGSSCCGD